MFLSHQTYTGILINVHSTIEMVLGMAQITTIVTMMMIIFKNYVLAGRVSQDPTEEHFGCHRAARRRNEHPSLYQFGYDSHMIRMPRSVVHVTGNSKGAPAKKEEIESPLA